MTVLLPIIEELADASDDRDRAAWLTRCPLSVLLKYESTIRNRLMLAGFAPGLAYLDTVLSHLRAVRPANGELVRLMNELHFQLAALEQAAPSEA